MTNKFYGIGVGVGDPEEITIKAINTLKKLDVVILPEAKKDDGSVAYEIAKQYMKEDVEKVFVEFPMLKSLEERENARKENAKIVQKLLDEGKNVGFLTIGDTMTYSTYVYILEHLPEKYLVETVPGVSSFVDMASRFNFPLMIGDETLKVEEFPNLKNYVSKTLITTDGTTLLGADDKSGIVEIIEAVKYLKEHPEIKHGDVKIAFGPDEEIGRGADYFDVKEFAADYAYTMDGGPVGELEYESFNAAQAKFKIKGVSVHPGTAKGKMINASLIASEIIEMFPKDEVSYCRKAECCNLNCKGYWSK